VIVSNTEMRVALRQLKLHVIGALLAIPLSAATCESLGTLSLPHTTLTLAQTVPAAAKLPAYCRVALTLSPTSDSDIKAEVWLPTENWNGKLQASGNGGWSGSISATTLASGLARGYATAMSDLGHQGSSASFALGHPEKLIDFAYRAAHETTVAAKAIVSAYYGRAPKYSYWTGCSAGGRSALMEAQRFPDDFDGIVAGSPGLNWTGRATQAIWIAQASHKDESSYIPPAKYAMIHQAVLEACDAADGVTDGVLNDPTKCKFDPATLRCKDADGPNCLTNPQVAAAHAIYSAVINPRTEQQLSPGSERGSEMGWATMAGPHPLGIGFDLFRYIAFKDPAWDYKTLNFDIDIPETAILNAMDPHLDPQCHGARYRILTASSWCLAWRTAVAVTVPPLSIHSRRSNNGWKAARHPHRFRPRVFDQENPTEYARSAPTRSLRFIKAPAAPTKQRISNVSDRDAIICKPVA
jgi:feruloyl esterase